jgi:hypothetical protein
LVTDARFFEYPNDFRPPENGMEEPSFSYDITVRAGGVTHSVRWGDCCFAKTEEANRLRTMLESIMMLISEWPEVKALPEMGLICL